MDDTAIKNQPAQIEPIRSHKFKRFLQQADWTLSRLISFLFHSVVLILLITLGLSSLAYEITNIFEYQKGLADISTIEFVFVIGSLILLIRYWNYTKQTTVRWWTIVSAPVIWYGKFVLFAVVGAGGVAMADSYQGTEYFITGLLEGKNYDQLLSFSAIWLSVYIAVPSQKLIKPLEISAHLPNETDEPQATQATQAAPEVNNDL